MPSYSYHSFHLSVFLWGISLEEIRYLYLSFFIILSTFPVSMKSQKKYRKGKDMKVKISVLFLDYFPSLSISIIHWVLSLDSLELGLLSRSWTQWRDGNQGKRDRKLRHDSMLDGGHDDQLLDIEAGDRTTIQSLKMNSITRSTSE